MSAVSAISVALVTRQSDVRRHDGAIVVPHLLAMRIAMGGMVYTLIWARCGWVIERRASCRSAVNSVNQAMGPLKTAHKMRYVMPILWPSIFGAHCHQCGGGYWPNQSCSSRQACSTRSHDHASVRWRPAEWVSGCSDLTSRIFVRAVNGHCSGAGSCSTKINREIYIDASHLNSGCASCRARCTLQKIVDCIVTSLFILSDGSRAYLI